MNERLLEFNFWDFDYLVAILNSNNPIKGHNFTNAHHQDMMFGIGMLKASFS